MEVRSAVVGGRRSRTARDRSPRLAHDGARLAAPRTIARRRRRRSRGASRRRCPHGGTGAPARRSTCASDRVGDVLDRSLGDGEASPAAAPRPLPRRPRRVPAASGAARPRHRLRDGAHPGLLGRPTSGCRSLPSRSGSSRRSPQQIVGSWHGRRGSPRPSGFATFDVTLCDAARRGPRRDRGLRDQPARRGADFGPGAAVLRRRGRVRRRRRRATGRSPRREAASGTISRQGIRPEEGGRPSPGPSPSASPGRRTSLDGPRRPPRNRGGRRASAEPPPRRRPRRSRAPTSTPSTSSPRNDIERMLAGFWQELLGVGQVGVETASSTSAATR